MKTYKTFLEASIALDLPTGMVELGYKYLKTLPSFRNDSFSTIDKQHVDIAVSHVCWLDNIAPRKYDEN